MYDYLVKPIVMQEFVQTVRKLQALCEQERRRTPETVGSLESVLAGALHSGAHLDGETSAFLEKVYGLGPEDRLLELLFYLGDGFSSGRDPVRKRITELLNSRELGGFCLIDVEYDKAVLTLVYGYSSRQDFETWYQYQVRLWLREAPEGKLAFGITEAPCANSIRDGYQQLEEHMDWSLTLGEGTLISCPEITRIQTEVCGYPIELENQIKISICAGDLSQIHRLFEQFQGTSDLIQAIQRREKEVK